MKIFLLGIRFGRVVVFVIPATNNSLIPSADPHHTVNYYLDIETTGLAPESDRIITIQYAPLERYTSRQTGELRIIKRWEHEGEKEMLMKLIRDTSITSENRFEFIATGYNLAFEHKFLNYKSRYYNLAEIDVLFRPHIDLHTVGILMNRGEFKGSGLDKITGKRHSGIYVPDWYKGGEYDKIEQYVKQEFVEFIKFAVWIYKVMPTLKNDTTD